VSEPISSGGWVHQKLQNDITWLASELTRMKDKNARLKAEVEELKSQPDPLTAYLYADTLRRDDIKTLKAHIERLTKAGDAFVLLLEDEGYNMESIREVDGWNAAKEGKPQS
jgi:predicted RNase H-like nuclease (RuvC/YqgF family)